MTMRYPGGMGMVLTDVCFTDGSGPCGDVYIIGRVVETGTSRHRVGRWVRLPYARENRAEVAE